MSLRQPRLIVTNNGVPLTGVIEAEVTNSSHFTADSFRLVIAANGLPAGMKPDYWALASDDLISISVIDKSRTELILGRVDSSEYNPCEQTLVLTGRDLSAELIDTKTDEKFINLTSSQIAEQLAARHGLATNIASTNTLAGTYYNIDHVVLAQEQTEWDLLIYLAKYENFDVWVGGRTLNFVPSPLESVAAYTIVCPSPQFKTSTATRISLSRSYTLARDVIVTVRTWNQKQQKPFHVSYHVRHVKSAGKPQRYTMTVPNLTRDQAVKLAKSTAEDITKHERLLTVAMPGDNALSTRQQIQLFGSGTAYDQKYYPDTITRHISPHAGYVMDIRAKNHSTVSDTLIG